MKNNNPEKECDENASSVMMWLSIIGSVIIVVVGVCVYPYVLRFFVGCKDVNILGPYGDMYGPLNPLVSAFAFIALVYSLSMHGRQLKLQRKDLQNQREDLALQRKEMEKQREVSEAQTRQFEAQVELAEKGQKIDELYKRLTIVVQLAEAVVFASINTSISSEARRQESEFSEKATRAIILIHSNLISILRTVEKDAKLLQANKLYIYDRFLNIERWLGATLNVLQYVRHNFDEEEAVEYAKMIMSTCSNSQKFLVYTFAGADNHERGEEIRSFLTEKQIIPHEIILDILYDNRFRENLDELLLLMNTRKVGR